jgi:hypothetical protein
MPSQTFFNSPSSVNLNVVSKTTTYSVLGTDDVVFGSASGGIWTGTLPSAVTNTGKVFTLSRTDQTLANPWTIAAAAGNVGASATTTIDTQYETLVVVSDGTNYQILERRVDSTPTSYTAAWVGLGTVSNSTTVWSRPSPKWMRLDFGVTSGTPTAVPLQLPLPSSALTCQIVATTQVVGTFYYTLNAAIIGTVLASNGEAFLKFGLQGTSNTGTTPLNGNAIMSAGQGISGFALFPITQWKS